MNRAQIWSRLLLLMLTGLAVGCSSGARHVGPVSGSGGGGGPGTGGGSGGDNDAATNRTGTGGTSAGGGAGGWNADADSTGGIGGGPPSPGPNCVGLSATCGPVANENCCTSLTVPGGTFYRGYDGSPPYAKMDYPATVSTFALDKYEVTVGRYRAFVRAGTSMPRPVQGAGEHPQIPGSGWNPIWNKELPSIGIGPICVDGTWTDTAGRNENLPINCISWYEAFAFCIWDGGWLPTEAEWNYAAVGGSEQRTYPWGSVEPDASRVVFNCLSDAGLNCATTAILPVGSKPDGNGKFGHADLAGNVWEWVLDQDGKYPVPCDNCATMPSDQVPTQVTRGGAYENVAQTLRVSAARSNGLAGRTTTDLGFRCARAAR